MKTRTSMIMAAFLALAMMVSVIPMGEAGVPVVGTNATIGTVSPGNSNYTTVPAYINFTATITGLNNETPYINLTNEEYLMSHDSVSGDFFYNWTSNITEGIFTYWVVIRDNSTGNISGKSENYTIMIDATGPVITAPSNHVEGNPTVITITDAVSGVKNATITIKEGNSSMYSSTINATDGRIDWSRDIGPGTYNYTIEAVDVFGNEANASGNFTVTEDTSAPLIENVAATPVSAPQGSHVNITADVTDAGVGVDKVMVNITYPDGTYHNESMVAYGNTYSYNMTYLEIGSYSFFIWANDTNNNVGTSSAYSFEINDATAPTINNYSAAAIGATRMLIAANITDNHDSPDALTVTITIVDSSAIAVADNVTMIYNSTTGLFAYLTDALQIGDYTYTIYVEDSSGNTATVNGAFSIVDSVAPSITNVNVPSNIVEHQNVTITCVVQDNVDDAENLTVTINVDGKSSAMTYSGSNNVFEYIISDVAYGEHTYTITATDLAGNTNSVNGTFSAADMEAPEIDEGNSTLPTQGTLGEEIVFSVALEDDDPVTVTLYYSVDGGNETSVQMTQDANGNYVAKIKVDSGSSLTYRIVADDGQSGATTVASGTITLSEKSTISTAMLAGIGVLLLIIIIAVVMMMKKKPAAEQPSEESSEESEETEDSEEISEESSEEEDELGEDL